MALPKKQADFLESADGVKIRELLFKMAADASYNTDASYSSNTDLYPNNRIPFVDKHMNYLMVHQDVDPIHYLANLRLMTRLK
jgi:hypothetical protein